MKEFFFAEISTKSSLPLLSFVQLRFNLNFVAKPIIFINTLLPIIKEIKFKCCLCPVNVIKSLVALVGYNL